jgi:hypothetical protein
MHYFIFPNKNTYITTEFQQKNFGNDEIVELRKIFSGSYSTSAEATSRILIQFDYSDVSSSIVDGTITSPKFYLRMYEVEGQTELDKSYSLSTFPLSQSWEEGVGKLNNNPKTKEGVTWEDYNSGSAWSLVPNTNASSGSLSTVGGGVWITGSGYEASQSFVNQSPDVEMDITDIVNKHLGGADNISNNGFILRFSGSIETDSNPYDFKFFSRHTHTIYSPKLEVRWDDHSPCTGSNTGSLTALTMSGELENHIFIKGLQPKYKESEKVRFRVGCRKKFVQKTFTESMLTSSFYIPEGSGSYSLVDVATNTSIVPFGAYTSMSCDTTSAYFDQWLNAFEPGRYYKVLFKLKYDDGQEIIYDNNEEFKVI